MASGPPSSWLPEGWTAADVGHGILDAAGLVPVLGEGADLANAAWYAVEGDYLSAGLSIVSMVPIVGDVIGKGGKLVTKLGPEALARLAKAIEHMDFARMLAPLAKHPKIGPYVSRIEAALEGWRKEILEKAGCKTPTGVSTCPLAAANQQAADIVTHGWRGNPMDSEVGREMVEQLKKSMPEERAIAKAQELLESGKDLPKRIEVRAGDELYKLSPGGASPTTPYWVTKSEIDKLRGMTNEQIASHLGLPPGSIPKSGEAFKLQMIKAEKDAVIFQSEIAKLSQGDYSSAGGAIQSLVTDRTGFSPPSPPIPFK